MVNPSEIFEDRKYQPRAIEKARELMSRGVKRFIFQAPTGSGKTILAGMLAKRGLERGSRMLFAAHRRELVLEPRKKFIEKMGIPASAIGIVKAGEEALRNPGAPIQIVSIQTVYGKALPPAQVVVIDECHLARAAMYEWLIKQYEGSYIVGLTATPERTDKKPLGEFFEDIVVVAQPSELFAGGYIAMPRMYTVPDEFLPDLAGIHRSGGDFDENELTERVMSRPVMGSIPDHWALRARGLRTMLFAASVKHSRAMVDLLNGAGIRAKHVDGKTPTTERDSILDELKRGVIDVICQVGLWIEGLDMPELKCVIMARPTESDVIHRQTTGRILRPWEEVTPILLDHAGNCRRLGLPTADKDYDLFPKKKKRGEGGGNPEMARHCECGEILPLATAVCPACGKELKRKEIKHIDGVDLVEVENEDKKKEPSEEAKRSAYNRFWQMAYRDGFDEAWVLRRFAEKFGNGPPTEWTPPERPVIAYTIEQKRNELNRLSTASHKQNLPQSWVDKKFELKFGHPIAEIESRGEPQLPAPSPEIATTQEEKVDLEF